MEIVKYWYEMVQRPPDIGCQPKDMVEINHDIGRHGIVAYERELTERELNTFTMRKWDGET